MTLAEEDAYVDLVVEEMRALMRQALVTLRDSKLGRKDFVGAMKMSAAIVLHDAGGNAGDLFLSSSH